MTTSEKEAMHQGELHKKLWDMANNLRGQMEAYEFKNYILGVIFYRFLSEKTEMKAEQLLSNDGITYQEAWNNEEIRQHVIDGIKDQVGYIVEPKYLFSKMIQDIEDGKFDIEQLDQAINAVSESTLGTEAQADFENLFDDMDLQSSKLGRDVKSKSSLMAKILTNVNDIPFLHDDIEIDVLGDAYEYLISQFAATAGKKAGEFYTPAQVSKILAKIVTVGKKDLKSVYDPACGSASLLLRVGKEANVRKYYGQELTSTTYNLARMNMLLHNVSYSNFDLKNDDTIENPRHIEHTFDAVVANPPYSANWSAKDSFLTDERFSDYGKLAPKSKADFAFVQHMIHQLSDKGTMAVVLPHGVLFRGAAEGTIRKYLIEERNYLDAVIGLPANIFYGTSIPTCVLVFKKCREEDQSVIFIDGSNAFEKAKNKNKLRDDDVEKIVNTYMKRETIDKYSYNATLNEIKENDYNLNIPRYVDTFEEEEPVDIQAVKNRLEEVDQEIEKIDEKLAGYLKELEI